MIQLSMNIVISQGFCRLGSTVVMIFLNSFLNNFILTNQINNWSLISQVKRGIKSFSSIPGPTSLPVLGTLYQYIPIFGKKN